MEVRSTARRGPRQTEAASLRAAARPTRAAAVHTYHHRLRLYVRSGLSFRPDTSTSPPTGRLRRGNCSNALGQPRARNVRQVDHAVRARLLRILDKQLRLGLLQRPVEVPLVVRRRLLGRGRERLNHTRNGRRLVGRLLGTGQTVCRPAAHRGKQTVLPQRRVEAWVSAFPTHPQPGTRRSAQPTSARAHHTPRARYAECVHSPGARATQRYASGAPGSP